MNAKFENVTQRLEGVEGRFEGIDRRFDYMRALWLAERVEEITNLLGNPFSGDECERLKAGVVVSRDGRR